MAPKCCIYLSAQHGNNFYATINQLSDIATHCTGYLYVLHHYLSQIGATIHRSGYELKTYNGTKRKTLTCFLVNPQNRIQNFTPFQDFTRFIQIGEILRSCFMFLLYYRTKNMIHRSYNVSGTSAMISSVLYFWKLTILRLVLPV